jgi:putative ABC transport system substrate-binding protein
MRVLGSVEGRNFIIEHRAADGVYDRLPQLAAELLKANVNVIVTVGVPAALAAKRSTAATPIVAVAVGDPVGVGLVTNLARPGENVTGLSHFAMDLSGKQVDLFKQAVPSISRIGVLYNPTNALHARYWRETQTAAQVLGVTLMRLDVRDSGGLAAAFDVVRREREEGLIVLSDPLLFDKRQEITRLAAVGRLPTMSPYREYAKAGGLLAYGPSLSEIWKRAAVYVDKILKGAKPADLPVEQPTKVELVINLKTAKALGLTIPPSLLQRADEIIQ